MERSLNLVSKQLAPVIRPIVLGGTGATDSNGAITNLGGINISKLGQANGIAPLDNNNKIPLVHFPPLADIDTASLIGPNVVYTNESNVEYLITNYDSFETYTVSVNNGTISRDKERVIFTPLNHSYIAVITINGKNYGIPVIVPYAEKPIISFPQNNLIDVPLNSVFISTIILHGIIDQIFTDITWQIATDELFTNLVYDETIAFQNLELSSLITPLEKSTSYYVRVRYFINEISSSTEWSDVIYFTTSNFSELSERQIIYPLVNGSQFTSPSCTHVAISKDSNLIVTSNQDAYSTTEESFGCGSIYIFTKNGGLYNHQFTIHNPYELQGSTYPSSGFFGLDVIISNDNQKIFVGSKIFPDVGEPYSHIYVYKTTIVDDYSTLVLDQILYPPFDLGGILYYDWTNKGSLSLTADEEYLFAAYTIGYADVNDTNYIAPLGCVIIYKKINGNYEYHSIINNPCLSDVRNSINTNLYIQFGASIGVSDDGNTIVVEAVGYKETDESNPKLALIYEKLNNTWTYTFGIEVGSGEYVSNWTSCCAISPNGNIVITANNYTTNGNSGLVYIAKRTQTGWVLQSEISLRDILIGLLPHTVLGSVRGDDLTVSCIKFSPNGEYIYLGIEGASSPASFIEIGEGTSDGCVVLCSIVNNIITPLEYLFSSNGGGTTNYYYYFGTQFAVNNKTLVVASWSDFETLDPNVYGGAYVFE